MPLRSELSTPAMRAAWQMRAPESVWPQIAEILTNPDLLAVGVFATIGLLATLWLMPSLPFSSSMAALLPAS